MAAWNPELYLKFGERRSRPALDLALRARSILEGNGGSPPSVPSILDLGCGPGNYHGGPGGDLPRRRASSD